MFDLDSVFGFGSGNLNDCEISDGATDRVNSYARVTAISNNQITVDKENWRLGDYENFQAGNHILIHVSAGHSAEKLGCYLVATILLVTDNIFTLDKDFSTVLSNAELDNYFVQAITFANFDCLKLLDGGILTPPPFDPHKFFGGILAVKVKNDLVFDGGHISLADSGIPTFYRELRPLTEQEIDGGLDSTERAGEENFELQEKLLLNCGDGAAFIVAKNISANENSRIGNLTSHGKPHCRGAADSTFKPSNITNVGGSTILIATEKFTNFCSNLISKYRTTTDSDSDIGKGLARAYVAEKFPKQDGLLFAGDFLSDKNKLSRDFNLHGFGNGEDGELSNPAFQLNNFANIFASHGTKKFFDTFSRRALINFAADRKILLVGQDFYFDTLTNIQDDYFETATDFDATLICTVPQFSRFSLSQAFAAKKIFAVLVNDLCNLENAEISAEKILIAARTLKLNAATKFNAPTWIVADSVQGLSQIPFKEKNNFVFANEVS